MALKSVHTAFYLIHAMDARGDFARRDREAAARFGSAAKAAGVQRIIYLGGLGRGPRLSEHLASRHEIGRVLAESGVPTIELRASIIIGSGSLSFEMVRALVERLPVMITPRWVSTRAQPIAIEDVIAYLLAAFEAAAEVTGVFEIGGADAVTYGAIMREYARQRGLRRSLIPVPVLTPRLSSLWLRLVTPLHATVGRALIEGVRNETIVVDDRARRVFDVRPLGFAVAIERALHNEDRAFAETRWCDAFGNRPSRATRPDGPRLVDSRAMEVACDPAEAFEPICRLGGETGWYYGNWLWRIRGALDLLVGGPGLRRGRRDPRVLRPGDALVRETRKSKGVAHDSPGVSRPLGFRFSTEMQQLGAAGGTACSSSLGWPADWLSVPPEGGPWAPPSELPTHTLGREDLRAEFWRFWSKTPSGPIPPPPPAESNCR